MKIRGTCNRCGRDFLVEQVIEVGGECPWDGEPFSPDYAAVLVDALRDAEEAGTELERALRSVADLGPAFTFEASSVVSELKEQIDRLGKNLIRQG